MTKKTKIKALAIATVVLGVTGLIFAVVLYQYLSKDLPEIFSIEDYQPRLVSDVYARGGEKIGEFYDEQNRKLLAIEDIPEQLRLAFISAEDSRFYEHNGFNFQGIMRAVYTNFLSGERTQGASTITQQTARTLFLSSEKTITRKLKEAILARRMESHLEKDEILYLYLNQVYFGQGAYGVASAAETYFRKKVKELTLAEMAMIAGLLTAPSSINPVSSPPRAKTRQLYVLKRMFETERISQEQYDLAKNEVVTVYRQKKYKEVAPFFVESIRQVLSQELGQDQVLYKGLKIFSTLDYKAQQEAQKSVRKGLRDHDKRLGYRGPKSHMDLADEQGLIDYLTKIRDKKVRKNIATFKVYQDGSTDKSEEFKLFHKKNSAGKTISNIPYYLKIDETTEGVVVKIDKKKNLVYVRVAESQGIIPLKNMAWARKRDSSKIYGEHLHIKNVSKALKVGDVIDVRIVAKTANQVKIPSGSKINLNDYAELALEQEPMAESALISFDLNTDEIIAMVGGSDWSKTKLNRAYQAKRQTGSSFKPIVYAAALEKGLTPATPIMGSPIVYNRKKGHDESLLAALTPEEEVVEQKSKARKKNKSSEDNDSLPWKPGNYGGRFTGDILLRNALKRSLNAPTIRVLEKAGVPFVAEYAQRLGIFSSLNLDMSIGLGTSGVTLYEMTKVFATFARLGKMIRPLMIHDVKNHQGESLLEGVSFDIHFAEKIDPIREDFATKRSEYEKNMMTMKAEEGQELPTSPFFFNSKDQLISPQTAYLVTSILQAVVNEQGGTGGKARALNREVAGKTGTTNGYFDAWFMGFTPQVATGVWVGFDREQTLGKGESGGKTALPIWLSYMKEAVKDQPKKSFSVPNKIVFANIDNETGELASADSHFVVRQAFLNGTEPGQINEETIQKAEEQDKTDLLRQDF